jgi:hypothetical protein
MEQIHILLLTFIYNLINYLHIFLHCTLISFTFGEHKTLVLLEPQGHDISSIMGHG